VLCHCNKQDEKHHNSGKATHPLVHSDDPPPSHTLMVEASMFKKGRKNSPKISPIIHEIIVATLGDENVQQSGTNTKIDPVLRLYPHAQFMCNSTKDLKKGRDNGTLCRFVSIKLKD
jgi:hypothetical protein